MIPLFDDELDELIKYRNGLTDLINRLEQLGRKRDRIRRCIT